MNDLDKQLCFLRELVMAKQAYDRSRNEFCKSVGYSSDIIDLDACVLQLSKEDARELTVDELIDVKEAIKP